NRTPSATVSGAGGRQGRGRMGGISSGRAARCSRSPRRGYRARLGLWSSADRASGHAGQGTVADVRLAKLPVDVRETSRCGLHEGREDVRVRDARGSVVGVGSRVEITTPAADEDDGVWVLARRAVVISASHVA